MEKNKIISSLFFDCILIFLGSIFSFHFCPHIPKLIVFISISVPVLSGFVFGLIKEKKR